MELRSGRRLRRSSPPPEHGTAASRRTIDLISALPDEMLLLVLARLHCVRTAMQTSLLSRRWRGLWIGLTDLAFRGLSPYSIQELFRRFAAAPHVSTLDIQFPRNYANNYANSLLRAATRLSPKHLVFTLEDSEHVASIELPCFECTTSIELDTCNFLLKPLPAGEFTALVSLSVTGRITNLGSLLNRCPCLRVLSVTSKYNYSLHIKLPPDVMFPTLENLSLRGKIVDLGSLLSSCQGLRMLSVTQLDETPLRIMLPSSRGYPVLEKLSLSGNIADLGTLLKNCPRLHTLSVTFEAMSLGSIEAALTALEEAAPLGLVLSHLGIIGIPWRYVVDAAHFATLVRTAARLFPKELVFENNFYGCTNRHISADLPCFPHATLINMRLQNVCFTPLPGEFSALRRLSLSGLIVDIGTLVTRCPRLSILVVTLAERKITIHSASLQELHVHNNFDTKCIGIDIVTPLLKQLHLGVRAGRNINISISAPMVENVSWKCWYAGSAGMYGSWRLHRMRVETLERRYVDKMNDTCSHVRQFPRCFHSLCLDIHAGNHLGAKINFAQEMAKLPFTNFYELELNFESDRHVYGPLVLQLLRMHCFSAATKNLKIVLPWFPKAKQRCAGNCPCDEDWRTQSTFHTSLEEVTIHGFNGEDHQHDSLRLILKCSPMLKSVTVRPSRTFEYVNKLSNISKRYPSVKFYL